MAAESRLYCRLMAAALLMFFPLSVAVIAGWISLPASLSPRSAQAALVLASFAAAGGGLLAMVALNLRAAAVRALCGYAAFEEGLSKEALYLEKRKKLLGALSHKLRTPLTTLEINLEGRSEDTALSAENRQRMERAKRATQKIAAFLDAQLDDLYPGRIDCDPERMEAREAVDQVLARIEALRLPGKLVPVYEDFDPRAVVRVDARLLATAILQLLFSLQEATPKGNPVKIIISTSFDGLDFSFDAGRPIIPIVERVRDGEAHGTPAELPEDASNRLRLLRVLTEALGGEVVATELEGHEATRVAISLPAHTEASPSGAE